jgi:hypothetical protein
MQRAGASTSPRIAARHFAPGPNRGSQKYGWEPLRIPESADGSPLAELVLGATPRRHFCRNPLDWMLDGQRRGR